MLVIFFFLEQKTAYEMRISDWSSDVCSSDLEEVREQASPGICRPFRMELRAKDLATLDDRRKTLSMGAGGGAIGGHRCGETVHEIDPGPRADAIQQRRRTDGLQAVPAHVRKDRKSTRLNSSH